MNFRAIAILLGASLCACAAPAPAALDPVAHARLTVEGFSDANAAIAARLESAGAWAVFPDVEDAAAPCLHSGTLFRRGQPPHPVTLRCSARPAAPAGAAYHTLVVIEDAAVLARLEREGLELAGYAHVEASAAALPEVAAGVWIVTSERGSLLFAPWAAQQRLEIALEAAQSPR